MTRKLSTTVYLDEAQVEALAELSHRTRVSVAEWVRRGIDIAIAAHRDEPGFAPTAAQADLDAQQIQVRTTARDGKPAQATTTHTARRRGQGV